jgi:hypothetical protein
MKRKLLIFFVLCLGTTYFAIWNSKKLVINEANDKLATQIKIVQESVSERFDLFLNTSTLIAQFAAQQFSSTQELDTVYRALGSTTIAKFPEVMGLNLVNLNGNINRVFPETNKDALHKKSQNYQFLLDLAKGQKLYWLSGPFKLYQGPEGFSFYVPYYQKGQPAGWVALVISSQKFFERFKLKNLLASYHLVIRDKKTGKDYFSTQSLPSTDKDVYSATSNPLNRELVYYLWPIEKQFFYHLNRSNCLIIAFLLTSFLTYSFYLYIQRKESKNKIRKITTLIHFTAEETTSTLTRIYNELNLMGKETGYVSTDKMIKYIHYITTLLDQMTFAEKFIHPKSRPEFSNNNIHPLLTEQIEMLKDKLDEKNLTVAFDESDETPDFQVWANKWLLCHSVLGNILRVMNYFTKENGQIRITFYQDQDWNYLNFNGLLSNSSLDEFHTEIMERSLVVASEVAKLSKGEIEIYHRPANSKTIVLKFLK